MSKSQVICPHCKRPVVLVPSASERARKFGGSASDYIRLFPMHVNCQLERLGRSTNPKVENEDSSW